MEYFEKIEENPYKDLIWNIPEKKEGTVNVIGGNSQSFRTEIKISEFLTNNFPIQAVYTILPDSLKKQLPNLPIFKFMKSTESGSFSDSKEFCELFNIADFNLVIGDLSKNSTTGRAVDNAVKKAEKPTILTRDSIDLVSDDNPEPLLMNENVILFLSAVQLQKLMRAIYYPKMFLLSQSLVQASEALHKFTLSYPISLITLYNGQILVAKNGLIKTLALEKTNYSPITFWNGELSAKILAYNLYNPNNYIEATVSALF